MIRIWRQQGRVFGALNAVSVCLAGQACQVLLTMQNYFIMGKGLLIAVNRLFEPSIHEFVMAVHSHIAFAPRPLMLRCLAVVSWILR